MKKFVIAAALTVASVLGFATPAFADSPGSLSNGATNYEVKNLTTGGAFSQSASATCNQTVKYSILLANSDFGLLKNLNVRAYLDTGIINASATNNVGALTSVSGKVAVTVDKGTLVYVPGSTVRISSDGVTRTPIADGIVNPGVNVGDLNGSTQTFIQFEAKVDCPVVVKDIQVCDLTTGNIVTIKENAFDANKHSMDTAKCNPVKVCDLATKQIVTIKEYQFDAAKHTKDLNKCTPAQPGDIKVCVTATKEIVTIKENAFDASKHSKDLNTCNKPAPVAPVAPAKAAPAVIAATGPAGTLATMFGLSGLAAAATYFVRGRNLLG